MALQQLVKKLTEDKEVTRLKFIDEAQKVQRGFKTLCV